MTPDWLRGSWSTESLQLAHSALGYATKASPDIVRARDEILAELQRRLVQEKCDLI